MHNIHELFPWSDEVATCFIELPQIPQGVGIIVVEALDGLLSSRFPAAADIEQLDGLVIQTIRG